LEGSGRDVLILFQFRLERMRKMFLPRVELGTSRIPVQSFAAALACWKSEEGKYNENI
jgi:hypothetical protein